MRSSGVRSGNNMSSTWTCVAHISTTAQCIRARKATSPAWKYIFLNSPLYCYIIYNTNMKTFSGELRSILHFSLSYFPSPAYSVFFHIRPGRAPTECSVFTTISLRRVLWLHFVCTLRMRMLLINMADEWLHYGRWTEHLWSDRGWWQGGCDSMRKTVTTGVS